MSDDAWNRFKPSKGNKESKKSAKIGWKSDELIKKPKKSVSSTPDLFSIWDDQKRMDAEEKKMAKELAETKKKAKELQKTLRKHQFGETKIKLEGKSKAIADKSKSHFDKTKTWVVANKKKSSGIAVVAVVLVAIVSVFTGINTDSENQTDTLGDSTNITSQELPKEKPDFPLLYPVNKTEEDLETVRNSPQGSAPSYVYVDSLAQGGEQFQVTQQEVPDNFDLEKTAKDFQASNIIQIDDNKVYHGYSEKAAIQSLMFVKDGKLVLIASPKQFPDDQWAGYIISLK